MDDAKYEKPPTRDENDVEIRSTSYTYAVEGGGALTYSQTTFPGQRSLDSNTQVSVT